MYAILLECDWGVEIAAPGDTDVCDLRAVQIVRLYDPHGVVGGSERDVKVCGEHLVKIQSMTEPHATEGS